MRTILHSPPILFVIIFLAFWLIFFALVPVVTSKHDDNHTNFANYSSHTVHHQQKAAQCGRHSLQDSSFQPFFHGTGHPLCWPLNTAHILDSLLYKVCLSFSNDCLNESHLQTHLSYLCVVALVCVYHNIFCLSLLTFYNLNDYNTF